MSQGYVKIIALGCMVVALAAFGYVYQNWEHISLNLRMRDVEAVRKDCIQLMCVYQATTDKTKAEVYLSGDQLPSSFRHLGAQLASVSTFSVRISFWKRNVWGQMWGFQYVPQGGGVPSDVRPTWCRDFYEFRIVEG